GAFGGIVLGALVRAIEACEPEPERRLRSIAAELVGPVVVGTADIEVVELRRGHGVSTFEALLRQAGEVLARATVVLGKRRDIDREWSPTDREPLTPWSDVPAVPVGLPFVPEFSQHFEYRVTGPMPFAGGSEPVAAGWIRARAPGPTIAAAELVALADAWWPAAFSIEASKRPIATVAFTLQSLLGDRELPGDRPLHHRARAVVSHDGFFVEHRELWTEAGELVALNQQTFVWIR
ncbi:MAG TPA: thioesterase family protein, partial [Nannocystaceae bacterium]|nr:thioesterase family protein [Nannocystaceae bacterium]